MTIAQLAGQYVTKRTSTLGGGPPPGTQVDIRGRFDLLTKYIPAETITLFVAAIGAMATIQSQFPGVGMLHLYIAFGALTPLIVFAIALGTHKQAGGGTAFFPPYWRMAAATIAYLVWAYSVPGMAEGDAAQILASLGALLISTILSLLEPIFER
jgi:hypothetical protein